MREEHEESGLTRRQTLALLTVVAVWLGLVYAFPKGWSWLAGLAGMAAYCVWAMRQKHPPHPPRRFRAPPPEGDTGRDR